MFKLPHVSGNNGKDPISKKKLESGKGQWEVRKEVLGLMVDGATQCIELLWDKKSAIDTDLHNILHIPKGVPFKRIEKIDWKNPTCSNISTNRKKIDDAN